MATEVIMPQMGFDMKEGTLVRWLKAVGEEVRQGECIAEIETDKAVVELEAYGSGVLRKTYIQEGTTVPVGRVIAIIAAPDEEVPDVPPDGAPATAAPAKAERAEAPAAAPAPEAPQRRPGERVRASPLARREAERRNIDIALVPGTGPNGRITRKDVERFAEEAARAAAPPAPAAAPPAPAAAPAPEARPVPAAPALGERVPHTRMRQAIARSMSHSMQTAPHFYVTVAIDMTAAMRLRQQINQALAGEGRVSVNDMIMKACAKALLKHTYFNATYTEDGVQVHPRINVGMAVAVESGLVAPAVLDVDKKGLVELARETRALAERARTGHLTSHDLGQATFTVSNLGMYGVESFTAIITPPQAGALAVGAVREEAVVRDGHVSVAQIMRATLSTDHRVADGAQAAAFAGEIRAILENPVSLLL